MIKNRVFNRNSGLIFVLRKIYTQIFFHRLYNVALNDSVPFLDVAVADLPDGSSAPLAVPEPYSSLTDDERMLGLLKPVWIADEDAPQCMDCGQRFTVLRRRHHCRACGRVLCAACCSSRAPIQYMDGRQARVCLSCLQVLGRLVSSLATTGRSTRPAPQPDFESDEKDWFSARNGRSIDVQCLYWVVWNPALKRNWGRILIILGHGRPWSSKTTPS